LSESRGQIVSNSGEDSLELIIEGGKSGVRVRKEGLEELLDSSSEG